MLLFFNIITYLFYIVFYCPLHFTVAHLKLIFKNKWIPDLFICTK